MTETAYVWEDSLEQEEYNYYPIILQLYEGKYVVVEGYETLLLFIHSSNKKEIMSEIVLDKYTLDVENLTLLENWYKDYYQENL